MVSPRHPEALRARSNHSRAPSVVRDMRTFSTPPPILRERVVER